MDVPYSEVYNTRNQYFLHDLRVRIARRAIMTSIKATARDFQVDIKTVRKWKQRYLEDPSAQLVDARPATTNHPQGMKLGYTFHLEHVVNERIRKGQRVYVTQLREKDSIFAKYSVKTLIKHLRRKGLYKESRKSKPPRPKDLRAVSDGMRFGECIQVDIKYLSDIPELKWSLKKGRVPRYQITARDRATGNVFLGYCREKSTTSTTLFIEYLLDHFEACGVSLNDCLIQTDNGAEFTAWYRSSKKTLFEQALNWYGVGHRCIPAGRCTYNSTVESFHNSIEILHYSNMFMTRYDEFFREAEIFQRDYNHRYIKGRGYSPAERIAEKNPEIDVGVVRLKPIEVETLLTRDRMNRWKSWQTRNEVA